MFPQTDSLGDFLLRGSIVYAKETIMQKPPIINIRGRRFKPTIVIIRFYDYNSIVN